MFPNSSWKEESVTLERGDLLCVYTDGVSEALDAADEEFGLERLAQLLVPAAPAEDLCRSVFDAVEAFAADVPQYDDQTLMLIRRQ